MHGAFLAPTSFILQTHESDSNIIFEDTQIPSTSFVFKLAIKIQGDYFYGAPN